MYKHVAWARKVGQVNKLTPTERSVLVLLCERANTKNECWPSVKSIARDTGFSRTTVQTTLRKLEDRGLLVTIVRNRKGGGQTSNKYHLQLGGGCPTPGRGVPNWQDPLFDEQSEEEKMKKTPSVSDFLSGGKSGSTTGKIGKSAKDVQAEIPDMSKPVPGEALKWVWVKSLAIKDPDAYIKGMTFKDATMLKKASTLLRQGWWPFSASC